VTIPPSSQPIGPGRLVLVVGPSGAGKDTVIAGTKAACAGDPGIVFSRRPKRKTTIRWTMPLSTAQRKPVNLPFGGRRTG
jgi:ABC-type phosphonate transport system ATPase subunit